VNDSEEMKSMGLGAELADYIRQNRETYTRDALNQRLLDEGYTEAEIEAAWKLAEQVEPASGGAELLAQPYPEGTRSGTRVSAGFVALYIVIIIVGTCLVLLTDLVLAPNYNLAAMGVTATVVSLASVATGVGLLVGGLRLLRRGWTAGRVSALMAVLALVWYLVLTGTCLTAPSVFR
jgi:hypothetical protein